jgi:subtilisin family serine protease
MFLNEHIWWGRFLALAATTLSFCAGSASSVAQDARYIIRFKSTSGVSQRDAQVLNQAVSDLGELGLQNLDRLPHDNAVVVRLRVQDAARIMARRDVEAVEADTPVFALRTTSDPLLTEQYSLFSSGGSGVTDAWDISTGSRRAMVAVIDTGVDLLHPDLRDNLWRNEKEIAGNKRDDDGSGCVDDIFGCDIVNRDGSPQDDNGHGTHVAGIVAALGDNSEGIAGVAFGAKIVAVKALDSQGSGFVSSIVKAIDYVTTLKSRGVRISVINLSLGGGSYSDALYRAVERARNHDILVVAAAGNESANNDITPLYPANLSIDSILSVAATDRDANLASFSNYGASSVQIAAPGSSILSTALLRSGVSYRTLSGTSMACPHVAGVLALIAAANPQLSMLQARQVLLDSSQSLSSLQGVVQNGAFVDTLAAVQRAMVTQGLPRIYGYVRRAGRGIRGAQVSATLRADPTVTRVAVTGKDGSYSLSELAYGDYTVRVRKRGRTFTSVTVKARAPGSVRKSFSALN